jgi:mono/diheme cytochrome c family protein
MTKYVVLLGVAILFTFASKESVIAQSPGAAVYQDKCQMCHAADGSGNTPAGKAFKARPFTLPEVLKQSDSDLLATMKNGKNKMPAFAGKLTDPQFTELIEYIHTLQKK